MGEEIYPGGLTAANMVFKRFALPNATSASVAAGATFTKGVLYVETGGDVFVNLAGSITSANGVRLTDDLVLPLEVPKGASKLYLLAGSDMSAIKANLLAH